MCECLSLRDISNNYAEIALGKIVVLPESEISTLASVPFCKFVQWMLDCTTSLA